MKFLIIDDHAVVREGVAALLRQAGPGNVVLEAKSGPVALEMANQHRDLDAVFLDLEMPEMDGRSVLDEFVRQHANLPVIILSSSESADDVRQALASGALGYVPKSAGAKTLLAALHFVLEGNVYVPPLLIVPGPVPTAVARATPDATSHRLTERQIEVLRLLERGLSNKEIGLALDLSEKTVKVHVSAIFRVLDVVNRTQAAKAARSSGLL